MGKINGLTGVKELFLALFLSAGFFKAQLAWLPVDLTFFAALATFGCVMADIVKNKFTIPGNISLILAFFALFLPSMFWTEWNSYAVEKTIRFFTLTMLAAVAPLFLIKTRADLHRFLNALAILGSIMAIDALLALFTHSVENQQVSVFGSSTIALGRAVGIIFIWVAIQIIEGSFNFPVGLGVLGALSIVLLGSGSRGPLLAVVASLLLTLSKRIFNRGRILKILILFFIVTLAIYLSFTWVPQMSLQRVLNFMTGELGSSELNRIYAYRLSWVIIKNSPWGIGLGGFAGKMPLLTGQVLQYPHNIILEIFMEGGFLPGLYFVFLIIKTLWKSLTLVRNQSSPEWITLLAILIFFLINTMVSGDLNDNKMFFAFMSLTMGLPVAKKRFGI